MPISQTYKNNILYNMSRVSINMTTKRYPYKKYQKHIPCYTVRKITTENTVMDHK